MMELEEHDAKTEQLKEALPSDEEMFLLSEVFKVFGDSTRIKIILLLMQREMCVYHLACTADVSQSAISHQLRILRSHKLVKCRREGKNIFYSLDDDHVRTIVEMGLEHINHAKIEL